jgi:hypothetical protein
MAKFKMLQARFDGACSWTLLESEKHMKNEITKEGRRSMNATATRLRNT